MLMLPCAAVCSQTVWSASEVALHALQPCAAVSSRTVWSVKNLALHALHVVPNDSLTLLDEAPAY